MHSYNVMDIVIVIELVILIFGVWAILHPEGWDAFNRRMIHWERRIWHKGVRVFKHVCRRIFCRGEVRG